jgi:GT2 family glycosyltransferase
MNFYAAFGRTLASRPIAALGALYWYLTGRKVRGRNRVRISLAQSPNAYPIWIKTIEKREDAIADAPSAIASWDYKPKFSVILHFPAAWGQRECEALVAMLHGQIYDNWELIIVPAAHASSVVVPGDPSVWISEESASSGMDALRIATRQAQGEWLLPISPESRLPSDSLYRFAEALQHHRDVNLLFGDNDWIGPEGRRQKPWFKPQWNSELVLAQDYISQAMACSRSATVHALPALSAGDRAAGYTLGLAIGWSAPERVHHVPHIVNHLVHGDPANGPTDRLHVVQAHLDQIEEAGAQVTAGPFGTVRVKWPLPEPRPLVSIIIPTRDKVSLLRACVSSLLARTTYRPFEILIVDNGSQQGASLAYLRDLEKHPDIRVLQDARTYNFSQLNNVAAAEAHGAYLCLLNNDTEITDGAWLDEMMRYAARPGIGAVGARLLYADGSIQHAGVVVGIGDAAGHAHRFLPANESGYFARTHVAHNVSAVTAACLVVAKEKFLAVGGFDENDLAIAFSDVDLCLKLDQAGWASVYVPGATLVHHESKSRGSDISAKHIERFRRELSVLQERWNTCHYSDPLHHQHLDRAAESYLIRVIDNKQDARTSMVTPRSGRRDQSSIAR